MSEFVVVRTWDGLPARRFDVNKLGRVQREAFGRGLSQALGVAMGPARVYTPVRRFDSRANPGLQGRLGVRLEDGYGRRALRSRAAYPQG
jgi:hypothetical protein